MKGASVGDVLLRIDSKWQVASKTRRWNPGEVCVSFEAVAVIGRMGGHFRLGSEVRVGRIGKLPFVAV